jgi:phthalate 4,5-dioxygenase oxygenase subunit
MASMLPREENEILVRTGPGTPMGELLREYWTPALRSQTLEADGAPVRVKLLGENFVAFRATDGRVGFFDEGCPHRCTSLALARNEDNALTCIFHGWKIDVTGKVVEVPSEPPERRTEFAAKVRVRHYPVSERSGIVWVYLGKRAQPPAFFDFEFTRLPATHLNIVRGLMHANWFQAFEGQLDSAHVGILHSSWVRGREGRGGRPDSNFGQILTTVTGPRFEMVPKPYGFREGALRPLPDGSAYARIRDVVLPYFSFIPNEADFLCTLVACVPVDDEWSAQWYIAYHPDRPVPQEYREFRLRGTSGDWNDFASDLGGPEKMWSQNRAAMKEGHWSGIDRGSIPLEDFAVTESMGPIVDRGREYLGSTDAVILRTRRMLLKAVRDFQQGLPPFGQEQGVDYGQIRSIALLVPPGMNWREVDSFHPPRPASQA